MVLPLFRITDLLIPEMPLAQKWGRVLNVASLSVIEPIRVSAYRTRFAARSSDGPRRSPLETARDGITVNTLLPGVIADRPLDRLSAPPRTSRDYRRRSDETHRPIIPVGRSEPPKNWRSSPHSAQAR